jgi:hypothetical protein
MVPRAIGARPTLIRIVSLAADGYRSSSTVKPLDQPAWSCSFHLHGDAEVAEALEALGELLLSALFEVVSTEVVIFDTVARMQ